MKLEKTSDREFTADEIGTAIVHMPHFQARKVPGDDGKIIVFDTFLENNRLGSLDGVYSFTREDVIKIVEGLRAWLACKV
jgi:hypothetical protein